MQLYDLRYSETGGSVSVSCGQLKRSSLERRLSLDYIRTRARSLSSPRHPECAHQPRIHFLAFAIVPPLIPTSRVSLHTSLGTVSRINIQPLYSRRVVHRIHCKQHVGYDERASCPPQPMALGTGCRYLLMTTHIQIQTFRVHPFPETC